MTQLRDARFKRALDGAPDADALPQEQTRRAIREAAQRAVAPASRRWSWWPAPQRRMPWNAAFATVLLAVLVALLWQGEEVPDARTSGADVQAPAAAPPAVPAAAPEAPVAHAPAAAPAPPPPAAPAPAPARERPAQASPSTADRRSSAPAAEPTAPAARGGDATVAREEARKSGPEDLARLRDGAPARQESAAADTAAERAAPAAPPQFGAPAAAPAMRAAPAPPAASSELAARSPPAAWREWTQLRIESRGRSLVVPRERARRMGVLLEQLIPEQTDGLGLEGQVTLRIELSRQDELLGTLEVAGDRLRWSAPDAPWPARTTQADAAQLRALRAEARRLLAR